MIPTLLTEAAPTPRSANANAAPAEEEADTDGFAAVFASMEGAADVQETPPDPAALLADAEIGAEVTAETGQTADPDVTVLTEDTDAEAALPDTVAFAPAKDAPGLTVADANSKADPPLPLRQGKEIVKAPSPILPEQGSAKPAAAAALSVAPGQAVATEAAKKELPPNTHHAPAMDLPPPAAPTTKPAVAQPVQPAPQPAAHVPLQANLPPKLRDPEAAPPPRIEASVATAAQPATTTAAPVAPPPAVALAQAMPATMIDGEGRRPLFPDAEFAAQFINAERQAATSMTPTAAPVTAGAETARQVANQIGLAVSQQPGKPVEIALHPEELGRVRLSLSVGDGVVVMALQAERAETQDLLRRHIDVLAQELRALGYDNLSFSFGSTGQEQTDDGDAAPAMAEGLGSEEPDTPATAQQLIPTIGLDLRL